jgi:hypothetical protein
MAEEDRQAKIEYDRRQNESRAQERKSAIDRQLAAENDYLFTNAGRDYFKANGMCNSITSFFILATASTIVPDIEDFRQFGSHET